MNSATVSIFNIQTASTVDTAAHVLTEFLVRIKNKFLPLTGTSLLDDCDM